MQKRVSALPNGSKLSSDSTPNSNEVGDLPLTENEVEGNDIQFHDIANRIGDGLWMREVEGGDHCIYVNKAFEKIWGRNLEEFNKITWAETVHPDDRGTIHQQYVHHRDGTEDYVLEYRIVRPDGEVRWVESKGYSILDDAGKKVKMAGIVRDVTREKKLESELLLAQKLESLGQLSAGIAHEINTPSQYVSDNISFLSESFQDLSDLFSALPDFIDSLNTDNNKADLEKILKLYEAADIPFLLDEIPPALNQSISGMEQIKKIVQGMKGFSHPGNELALTDINEAIRNTIIVTKNEWKYVADLDVELDSCIPMVPCIPSSFNQVMLNLIINAAHAIKEKYSDGTHGKILVRTEADDEYCLIKIKDNGSGIPESIKEKIFDPFFTTKEVGVGTGQGLSIAHKVIVKDHKGHLSAESTPGEGTCFTIKLLHKQTSTRESNAFASDVEGAIE